MKVSVIIPFFNSSGTLARAVDSVLGQTYGDVVCVLVDDCSADDSLEIAQEFQGNDSRVILVSHTVNRGLAAARNSGVEAVRAMGGDENLDRIFFLDSDDELPTDDTIEKMVAVAQTYNPDWVQGNYLRVEESKTWESNYHNPQKPFYGSPDEIRQNFDKLNFTNSTNKLIRLGFYFPQKEGLIFEDLEWSIKAYGKVQTIATLSDLTYLHDMRGESIMRSRFTDKKVDSILYILQTLPTAPDKNIQHLATNKGLFMLKNLLLGDFDTLYKKKKYRELYSTGVFEMSVDRASLTRFTKVLSYTYSLGRGFGWWYARLLCLIYKG